MNYYSEYFVNGGILKQLTKLGGPTAYRWVPVTPQDTYWLPPGGMVL